MLTFDETKLATLTATVRRPTTSPQVALARYNEAADYAAQVGSAIDFILALTPTPVPEQVMSHYRAASAISTEAIERLERVVAKRRATA